MVALFFGSLQSILWSINTGNDNAREKISAENLTKLKFIFKGQCIQHRAHSIPSDDLDTIGPGYRWPDKIVPDDEVFCSVRYTIPGGVVKPQGCMQSVLKNLLRRNMHQKSF